MIRVIHEEVIQEVVDFAWEICRTATNASYPIRKSRNEVELYLVKSMQDADDQILGYYKDEKLMGVMRVCVEKKAYYLQVSTYITAQFEKIMNELIHYLKQQYSGFKVHFGYPNINSKANDYFKKYQYRCIESSNDLRMKVGHFKPKQNTALSIQRVEKEQFQTYASFHDQYGGNQMYWNSKRVYEAFDSWHIYTYKEAERIVGSILICKEVRGIVEIFGLFVEKAYSTYEVIECLLSESITQILEEEKNVEQVIFFVQDEDEKDYCVATKIGFEDTGGYCCYEINL